MSRFARERRVFFFEEPLFKDSEPYLAVEICAETGVNVVVPCLKSGTPPEQVEAQLKVLLDRLIAEHNISSQHLLWYYTPMALGFSSHLQPAALIYDCMDELSAFQGAPSELRQKEKDLFRRVDVVFTGGHTLYEAKKRQHANIYAFPSSVDVKHFRKARSISVDPPDQASIPHSRLGYIGVIDERMDIELLREAARLRPHWHFVMVGPIAKIDPDSLPKADNIHYLGGKTYAELPSYLAGWDVALLPFARNASTRFISPTKTPEYLSAGRPVVSTSIRDVIQPYGEAGLVEIADSPDAFVQAAEKLMQRGAGKKEWLAHVDEYLETMSWDRTWEAMKVRINTAIARRSSVGGIEQSYA